MSPASLLAYIFWIGAAVFQLLLLVFMLRRDLREQFPFFFNYTLFQLISFCWLFGAYRINYKTYFYSYWTSSALSVFVGFFVLYEVFTYAIRPYAGLRELAMLMFRWAGGLLLIVSAVMAISSSGSDLDRITMAIVNLERSVRLLQCGLLLFLFVCSSYLGLSWKNFACGIALGFGVFAATDLAVVSMRAHVGREWNTIFSLLRSGAYNISVLTWFGYVLMPAAARARGAVQYRPVFDRWNQAALAVSAAGNVNSDGSYLSDLERTVETVMSKSR